MRSVLSRASVLALSLALLVPVAAFASDVDVAVVDVSVPTTSVTLAPGGSGNITINMSVTGNQAGTATFEVYRDWSLSGGAFSGSNPQEFTVGPRAPGDPATTFSTSGTVSVAAGHAPGGPFTLAVGAFDITNSNATGAKLAAGDASTYRVTVSAPPPPSDTTPPVITPSVSGTLGTNGWYTSNVTVSWSVVDNESTISSSGGCGPTTISSDTAGTTLTCTATSAGGTSSESVTIKRDATVPSLSPTVSPNPVLLNGSATATPHATDATSGVASSSCDAVDTSAVGTHSVSCTATDNAGNSAGANASYSVTFGFVGFDRPVDNNGVLNLVKAGQAIPLKWRLVDANNIPVTTLATATIRVVSLTCSLSTTTDQLEEVAAGASGLQNLGDGYYQLNWKSPTSYANSCKTLKLDLGEGSGNEHTALFSFRK